MSHFQGRYNFGQKCICTSAQWCVFNNYSLDKHRHQLWHHFYFSFDEWINKVALNFTTIYHKKSNMALFDGFHCLFIFQNPCSFEKKSLFMLEKKIFQRYILIQKFQELHFCFTGPFAFKTFGVRVWPLSFFLIWKLILLSKNAPTAFFLVRPRPLEQPPEAKLLSSVWTKRSKI